MELRRFPRIASQHAVLVKRLGGRDLEEIAPTTSMGIGGCGFLADEAPADGDLLEVLISVRHEVIKVRARVVYIVSVADGRHEVGVEFVSLDENDRERIQQLLESPEE